MLIKNQADLDAFKKMYGIDGEIEEGILNEVFVSYVIILLL